ncbi:MAG TPA: hypothetical protein PKC74_04890, partial [Turneriella sp.]|nr:hypothetical protein [Turneriella sp.]
MAFERLKRIFGGSKQPKTAPETAGPAPRAPAAEKARRRRAPRINRRSDSPYVLRPSLQKEAIEAVRAEIRRSPQRYRTDKFTLLEIAEKILHTQLQLPRPAQLRAHHVFFMFTRTEGRQRKGVTGACFVWKGAVKGGAPTVTTLNAQEGRRLQVDARTY